PSRP
ncbi:hypothetical protein BN1708_018940, partial [Verticillium longisporum]